MKFIFWQNIISIHQSSFLEALAVKYEVLLIVEEEIENRRKLHGWSVPEINNVKIIVNPNERDIDKILVDNRNEFHFFSGLEIYPITTSALKKAVQYKMKNIGILLEPYNGSGLAGAIRIVKYKFLILKYKNYIQILLPTGLLVRNCYEKISFPKDKIFDWGYFRLKLIIIPRKREIPSSRINDS